MKMSSPVSASIAHPYTNSPKQQRRGAKSSLLSPPPIVRIGVCIIEESP